MKWKIRKWKRKFRKFFRLVDDSIAETVENTEAVQIVDVSETVSNIYNDVHIIMVFIILTFAMSCMRAWRKNSLKGV